MFLTVKYTLKALLNQREIVYWTILFPIVMSTLFYFAFDGLEDIKFEPVPTAVVESAELKEIPGFKEFLSSVSTNVDAVYDDATNSTDNDALITLTAVDTLEDARELMKSREIAGAFFARDNELRLELAPLYDEGTSEMNAMILDMMYENFQTSSSRIERTLSHVSPDKFQDPDFISNIISANSENREFLKEVSVIHNETTQTARFFYALLGFAALMSASVPLAALTWLMPNLSALGARRSVSALPRGKQFVGTIIASWIISLASLLIAFLFMKYVCGVPFGNRSLAAVGGIVAASLMATSFGTAIAAIPYLKESSKGGIITVVTLLLALFAGLYGTPSLALADMMTEKFPLFQAINPVKAATDLFYNLYYFDTLTQFYTSVGILLIMTVVFSAIAAIFMRRQRYESI